MTVSSGTPRTPGPSVPALHYRGITAGYGRTTVLRNVDLVAPAGKVVALLGPNGAGKSTLLKVAAGLLAPTGGTVRIHGEDVTHLSEAKRAGRGLCLIPEGRGIFRQLTVRENLAMFAGGKRVAEAVELDLLELLGAVGIAVLDVGARLTCVANLTGEPACSVPCGFTRAGLPVGLMVHGRAFADAKVLRVAYAYEQASGWTSQRPGGF